MRGFLCVSSVSVALLLSACASPTAAPPAAAPVAATANALSIACQLKASSAGYAGSCEVPCTVNALAVNFDGVDAKRACNEPARTVSISMATTGQRDRWLGSMQGVKPEDPTRLEVVPNKSAAGSVARMPFGWFNVSELKTSADGLTLRVDASRQVRPNADDLAILDRAVALLPSAAVWNKADNRECPNGQAKLSLFCALMQATTEISGGVHYRQPAMQAVREELSRVDSARVKTHRIMDFNNHPDTTLPEIHALLRAARARVALDIR
jgi:hypothetical protein